MSGLVLLEMDVASEQSERDSQVCSIEIHDIYVYIIVCTPFLTFDL